MPTTRSILWIVALTSLCGNAYGQYSARQLGQWLERFPEADLDRDGRLTSEEVDAYRKADSPTDRSSRNDRIRNDRIRSDRTRNDLKGAPRTFFIDPGWTAGRFPENAVCYLPPKEIAALLERVQGGKGKSVVSYPKPTDGALRIVGTGHSFMAPGYRTFPLIAQAAGLQQPPLLTHTGGGVTGSARYKWEQENGIFGFAGKPTPMLLASIANAEWDAMMWGPYYLDRPEFYSCWVEFCLKYNPEMKFYLSDAWPQLDQLDETPAKEDDLTNETFDRMRQEKYETYGQIIATLEKAHPGRLFIMPTCDAMVLAVKAYRRGELTGIEGLHKSIGKKERSLWKDQLGHLGPGFDRLEGYVFYATIYGRSPEQIEGHIKFSDSPDFPNRELDRAFREIAWQAVLLNPYSGVVDENSNGISDDRE